ncbi:DUF2490 domain-containing protein [Sphingomonas jatrophae]|uniref:DUF2490 domain-containing protein n=1 Tax=Sphingomonas jatrophae TaxID=1166337 RepID=A0A1I6LLI2_9SPHN|nr:DUF2490 domain-containing protein [Sphingomonas jatrophae]SFS04122.1 Protein of unknown function [Sphingomonas jatrophae]
MSPLRYISALFLLLGGTAHARTVEDEQVWLNAVVSGTTKSGFAYWLEAQPRFTDGAGRLGQLLLRPMVGWKLSDAVTVYGGYAHVVLPIENGPDRNEDRLFGQVSSTIGKVAGGTLSSRTRLEYRDLSNGRDAGWRFRNWLRYVRPITAPDKTRALVYVEPFVALNDTDWGARRGFDQLRSFVGVEVPLKGRSTVELGYLNQLVNATGGVTRVNHVASLSLFIRP